MCKKATNIINKEREIFFAERLDSAKGDSKVTFKVVNSLLRNEKKRILPVSENENETANILAIFFQAKINNVTDLCINRTKHDTTVIG